MRFFFKIPVFVALAACLTPSTTGKECIPHDSYDFEQVDPFDLNGRYQAYWMNNIITRYLTDAEEQEKIIEVYGPIEDWCFNTSDERIQHPEQANTTSLLNAFQGHKDFNADISKWNISGFVNVKYMFDGCTSFNQDIGQWNITLTQGNNMFRNAVSFNQDLDGWQVDAVGSRHNWLREMFRGAASFNGNIAHWNVSLVTSLDMMFRGATSFQGNLSNWQIQTGARIDGMFMDTDYSGDAPFCDADCFTTKSIDDECSIQPGHYDDYLEFIEYYNGRKVTVIVPKIFSFLSIACSIYIIKGLIGTAAARRRTRSACYQRILLGLSVFDVISSFGYFFTAWAVPKNPPNVFHSDVVIGDSDKECGLRYVYRLDFPYAAGNVQTCTAQGFFIQVGVIGSVLLTALLSLSSLLTIKYNWREHKLRKFELFTVPSVVLFALGSATYLAVAGYFNPAPTGFCWIYPYPATFMYDPDWYWFVQNSITGKSYLNEDNLRGRENVFLFQILFAQMWVGISIITIIVANSIVFCFVRGLKRRNRRYGQSEYESRLGDNTQASVEFSTTSWKERTVKSLRDASHKSMEKVRTALSDQEKVVLNKAFQYTGVLLLIYIPVIVAMGMVLDWLYTETVLNVLLTSQGIFNALIYGRVAQKLCCSCSISCSALFCKKKEEVAAGKGSPTPKPKDMLDGEKSSYGNC